MCKSVRTWTLPTNCPSHPFCHVYLQPKGVNLYDMAGDSTWPIILVSYMYVKKDQTMTNPKTAAALKVGSKD